MSALLPKADIRQREWNARFGPIADAEWVDRSDFRRESHLLSRNARTAITVASGCSSMIQCPEFAMMPPSTLVPTSRLIAACCAPNDFSAPSARIGMVSLPLLANALLSDASCEKATN